MGCATSKLDDLPAVALCRDRCGFLDEAVRQRYALAQAHLAYTRSLAAVARSLHQFLEHSSIADLGRISSPVLDFPPKHKGVRGAMVGSADPTKEAVVHNNPVFDSGSHLDFRSDSDDDSSSSLHLTSGHIDYISTDHEESASSTFQGGILHMNYMKSRAAPAHVVYEQRLPVMSEETVHYLGEEEKPSLYPPYPYNEFNIYPNSGGIPYLYPDYSIPPPNYGSSSAASLSKSPPPPPPPPQAPALDFLNPFDSYDNNYYLQDESSSRDSKELREEEGIPDLEDEHEEVVMEVKRDHQDSGDIGGRKSADVITGDAVDGKVQREASVHESGSSGVSLDGGQEEYDVQVVEEVHGSEPRSSSGGGSAAGSKVFQGVSEVMTEIEFQFERASESGNEIAKMLEAGKVPHRRKHKGKYEPFELEKLLSEMTWLSFFLRVGCFSCRNIVVCFSWLDISKT